MKRKSLLFLLLFALMAPWAANAQTTVEIGDGTSAGYYTPIGTYYNYSITEQLYTADEIGTAGTITSISFNYAYTAAKDFPITVYMANVDATDLSTGISLADADEVFDGTLSVTEAGWVTIDLDAPFAYDGTSNLLIGINKGYCQWFSGSTWTYTAAAGMARYTQNDNNAYDLSTVPGTVTNNRPNIQITIVAGGGPVCEKPATMEASNVTTNSAVLTWTGGSGTYNVEYMGGSVTEWTSYLTNTTATTANLSGLTPGTNYQYRVQSVCTDGVSGWKSVSFMTMFGIPFVEEFGTAIPTGWAQYTGLLDDVMADPAALVAATYGWSFGTGNNVFDNHARCNIYSNYQRWLVLPTLAMENNVQLMFDLALTVYTSGSNASPEPGAQEDDKFIVLIQTNNGWEVLRQWDNAGSEYVYDNISNTGQTVAIDLSSYAGQNIAIAFYGESTVAGGDNNLHIDNVSIDYIPACAKPTNLAVNYENGNTATVTWEGNAAGYELDVNGTTYTTTNNTYSLTGLELATTYEVKVRANCGTDGYSDWTNTVSFTTDLCMPEDQCALTFVLADSYGDGWNGSYIAIYDYTDQEVGDVLATVTLSTGTSETQTLSFCNGQELAIIWTSGSSWDSECSYTITDLNGDIVAQNDVELAMAYTMNCTVTDCRRPTNLAVSEIGGHSVKLSWTENGPATSWVLAYISENDEEITEITVNTNPYTLTGLTPETMYAAQVTPVCEVDKPSEVVYWTTDVACPAPQDIVVSGVTASSALISWLGFGESYDLRYYAMSSSKGMRTSSINKKSTIGMDCKTSYRNAGFASKDNKPAVVSDVTGVKHNRDGWYYYDNGEYASSIGTNGGNFYWGIMIPAGTYLETSVTKTSVYDIMAMTGTVYIYNDGTDAPAGDALAQADVTLTGSGEFVETLFGSVTIDPSKNLWIVYYNGSGATYPAAYCSEATDANARFVSTDGEEWFDVATAVSSAGDWMMRAYLEGEVAVDWIEVNGITASEYELTGLDPETTYIVQIRSNCGEDGQSAYAGSNFTTIGLCDNPYDLEATDIEATSATLNWTGAQESYNLRYREALEPDPTAPATIILEAHDVWGDGSGYQMLLDADANTSGVLWNSNHYIYVDGEQYSGGDIPSSYYDEFEYTIPTNADGALETENVVVDGSVTITIPAGTYDYVILNPTPGDRFYIAANAGEVETANDDYVFEAGKTYHFTMQKFGSNDGAALEITAPMGDWTTVTVNDLSYALTGLTPETYYEWQVQGVNASCGELEWSAIQHFTTPELTTLTQTIELTAGVNYVSFFVETNLDDLKAALVNALGTSSTIIVKSRVASTKYQRGRWAGNLSELNMAEMYKIDVPTDCEISLEGMPIDPTTLSVTITPGANWIAYPYTVEMTLPEFFGSFPVTNDVVKSKSQNSKYNRGRWAGSLTGLVSGQGYIYVSADDDAEGRIFTFPATAK